ncbi:MAG: MarR family transcriptional regulator [Erysipelotrichaceae bacterium]|nr:MarR family transcriptional regulator [Erysipelotrichaceae bacterium]
MDYRKEAERLFENLRIIYSLPAQRKMLSLTRGELCVLTSLIVHGNSTPSELISYTDSSSAHVAKILRNLASKGEINRIKDTNDGRSVIISVTEKGRQQIKEIYDSIIEYMTAILKQLQEDDTDALLKVTDRIIGIQEVTE